MKAAMARKKVDKVKVLNIPGGGVFGYIVAVLMDEIQADPANDFDCFSGTSVGSQLAACYASGKSAQEVREFMEQAIPRIFHRSFWRAISPIKKYSAKYDDMELNVALQTILGPDLLMGDIKPLIVPAVDLVTAKPKIFDNISDSDDIICPVWEVCRASSAAPTYFAPWDDYIDGGLVANDPSTIACTALVYKKKVKKLSDISLLTVGTGVQPPSRWTGDMWTIAHWLKPLLDITIEGGNEVLFEKITAQLGLAQYQYWNQVELEDGWEMDDASLLPQLKELALKKTRTFAKVYEKIVNS